MKNKRLTLILIIAFILPALSFLSSTSIMNVSATPMDWSNPEPNGRFWDFNNNTIIGWHVKSNTGDTDLIYNISSMKYTNNTITSAENNFTYTVVLKQAYFNVTTMDVQEHSDLATYPIVNASIINYTQDYGFGVTGIILPYDVMGGQSNAVMAIPFIPNNGSAIDIHWVASRSYWYYDMLMGPGASGSNLVVTNNSISVYNSSEGAYANMTYYANGTLEHAELYVYFTGVWNNITYTRFFDFNPIDDTDWLVSGGENFYYGFNHNEIKLQVLNITNITFGSLTLRLVSANASSWNSITQTWNTIGPTIIGSANDFFPMVLLGGMSIVPFLLPIGYTIENLAASWNSFGKSTSAFDLVTYGVDWVQIENTTNGDYIYYHYLSNGTLNYAHGQGLSYFYGANYSVVYLKNISVLSTGIYNFSINPLGSSEFQIEVNISVSTSTQLFTAGFHKNPINITLNNGIIYFDIMVNDTGNLDAFINITVEYNASKFENIELYWYNTTSKQWESIPYIDLGNGKLLISIDHLSIFGVKGTLILPENGGNGPNGGTPPGGIPGYDLLYILLVFSSATVILILRKKKRFL